jgi:hypothetical protein
MAARFGGPGEGVYQCHPLHMTVNKPANINDLDLASSSTPSSLPLDQPTDMSYFLLRIRLAEISRNIVDHNLINVTSCNRPNYYAHIMAMDFELDQMMRDVPPFFQMETWVHDFNSEEGNRIFLQAYMLNSHIHSQRSKLHIGFLTSSPRNNPAYAASRDICLQSAKHIVRAELQMLRSRHPFVHIRLRFAAFLHGLFMAGIVLLMDTCIHKPESLDHDVSFGDLADALRMIKDMNSHSLAAATIYESLMQIVARYRAQHKQSIRTAHDNSQAQFPPTPWNGALAQSPSEEGQQSNILDNSMFMDNTQWDDLFTGIASSSFF